LEGANAVDFVDQLLRAVAVHGRWNKQRLYAVARWLVRRAPDREPVKIGLALLGLFRRPDSEEWLLALGRHEEFTLYSTVALQRTATDHEVKLWQLAKDVTGWGRIHIVERLAGTEDKDIQHWLLRDGCENDIMPEYTALICAKTGKLAEALAEPYPDDALLGGARVILSALLSEFGGFDGIESYADGALAASRYVAIVSERELLIDDFLLLHKVKEFLQDEGETWPREDPVWQRVREPILSQMKSLLAEEMWRPRVIAAVEEAEVGDYHRAVRAAQILALDVWEIQYRRLTLGDDVWHHVMQTDDPERARRVVQFAEATLPRADIATGPADEIGLGPEFKAHRALASILQNLRRFRGLGGTLILVGLRSPVVGNRHLAVQTLKAWPIAEWPPGTIEQLTQAAEIEPNDKTRALMQQVLAGH
jgi:hypothetical protein